MKFVKEQIVLNVPSHFTQSDLSLQYKNRHFWLYHSLAENVVLPCSIRSTQPTTFSVKPDDTTSTVVDFIQFPQLVKLKLQNPHSFFGK